VNAFGTLAAEPSAPVEDLALAIAAEFHPVDQDEARAELDRLAAEVAEQSRGGADRDVAALRSVLGDRYGFRGDAVEYDHPDNAMLDCVLERRRGLPILLAAVYVAVAARAGIPLGGVGLPGHFVVAHLGADPPRFLDPFEGGVAIPAPGAARPWPAQAIARRILNNLVASFTARGDLYAAIRAAELRLALPASGDERRRLSADVLGLRARLN